MKRIGEALGGAVRLPTPTPVSAEPGIADEVCPICRGAGWLRANAAVGHPMFGRPIMCECLMAEVERRRADELQRFSALEAFRNRTFDNFDPRVPGAAEAFDVARRYARDPYGWLLLRGVAGCGKTHLAASIANEAIQHGAQVLFEVVPDLLDHLRATYAPMSAVQYDELFEGIRTAQLLVLDDLGTESATPWAQEKLYQLINYRYNYEYPTVITTNRRLDSLDERIRSRISDQALCKVVEIGAGDYRSLKPGQRRPGTPGRPAPRDRR
jgi:DNA replication protein DnaC